MKKIFLVALAAIGMTACMQDEVVEIANGGAIAFDNAFVGNATRADAVTTGSLEAFKVWGYVNEPSGVVFNGTVVSDPDKDGVWGYDRIQYWMPENDYSFAAIAPVSAVADDWDLNASRTIEFTTDGTVDLVYAAKEVVAAPTYEKVAFQFEHLLSKVKLSFATNLPDGNVVAIENLKITTVATANIDLNVNDKVWTPGNAELVLTPALTDLATEEYFIVPATCKVEFDVVITVGTEEVYKQRKTATIPADAFVMGHAYNLCAEINPATLALDEIEFSAEVTDWKEVPNASDDAANLVYAAQIGGTYTLTNNVTVNAPVVVKEGVNFVLDLNGKTITAELKQEGRHHYAIDNYGTLTLKNGTINARGVENFGTMVIEEGVTITNVDTNGGSAIWNEGDLVINGGTFTTNAEAGEDSYGTALNTQKGGKAVINGGNFVANSQLSYAICNYGETVINNATVVGKHGAVAASEGAEIKTVINGGSFSLVENPNVSDHCVYYVSEIKGGTFTLGNNTDCGAQVFYESTIAQGYKKVEANGVWTVSLDTVDDTAELQAALADNNKKEIYLAPGATFEGVFNINRNVKILSSETDPATIKGRVNVSGDAVTDLSFTNVDFAVNAESEKTWSNGGSVMKQKPSIVMAEANNATIKFEKCDFQLSTSAYAYTNSTNTYSIFNECNFNGKYMYVMYVRANTEVTNCVYNTEVTNLIAAACINALENGKVVFVNNALPNGANIGMSALILFASTNNINGEWAGPVEFTVMNNTGFQYTFERLSNFIVNPDHHTFTDGSERFSF